MKKLTIVNARTGESAGGFACGPVGGHLVSEVQVRDEEGKDMYYELVDVDGILEFAITEESRFQLDIDENYSDDETFPEDAAFDDFYDFYEWAESADDKAAMLVMKLLVCLNDLNDSDATELIRASIGKTIDEIDIPVCESEQTYIEENSEEEEDCQGCEVLAIEMTFASGGMDVLPLGCLDEKQAPKCVERLWNNLSDEEKNKYTSYRVIRTEMYKTDTVGNVFSPCCKEIKRFK